MYQKTMPLHGKVALPGEDRDAFIDLDRLWTIAMRHLGLIAALIVVFVLLGIGYLLVTPPVYVSSARILVDEKLARFTHEDASSPRAAAQADSMIMNEIEILGSKRLARSVVEAENLANNDAFLFPERTPAEWLKDQVKMLVVQVGLMEADPPLSDSAREGKAAALLQQALSAQRVGRSYVIDIAFRAQDPDFAASITRAYTEAYLVDQLDANSDATERAAIWLQGRIDELRESSQEALLAVEQYRAANNLTAASGELLSEQQLSDLNAQLILAQAETEMAKARYEQFESILAGGPEAAVGSASLPADQGGSQAFAELQQRYAEISTREQNIAERFGEDHPQVAALRREAGELRQQIFAELQRVAEGYHNDYEVARLREESLRQNMSTATSEHSENGQSLVKLRELEQRATAITTLYQSYLARYAEASQQSSLPIPEARVISSAGRPVYPVSPDPIMALGFAAALGLLSGGGIAALREFGERYFRNGEDVTEAVGLKFLGYLPIVRAAARAEKRRRWRKTASQDEMPPNALQTPPMLRLAVDQPASLFAETLRNAKLSCDTALRNSPSKVIGVLSMLPHEGKTTTAANFASLLSANGFRTLLIDADLRSPDLTRTLGLKPKTGLADCILGSEAWQDIVRVDPDTGLGFIPSTVHGSLAHTSEVLSSEAIAKLLEEVRHSYSYIVVDLPPLGPVVDAKAFEPLADGFVFVAEWGATPRAFVKATLDEEPQLARKVLGMVLNKTHMKKLRRYGGSAGAERYMRRYGDYYSGHS